MTNLRQSFYPPFDNKIVDESGMLTEEWAWFFREVFERLYPLGREKHFTIVNNQSSAADVTGLKFSPRGVTCVLFKYLVQRLTSSVELTEAGLLIFVYNPDSENWSKITLSEENPKDAGITFTITAAGQVQYATDSQSGTPVISSLWYRAETLAGKNSLYSKVGAR